MMRIWSLYKIETHLASTQNTRYASEYRYSDAIHYRGYQIQLFAPVSSASELRKYSPVAVSVREARFISQRINNPATGDQTSLGKDLQLRDP